MNGAAAGVVAGKVDGEPNMNRPVAGAAASAAILAAPGAKNVGGEAPKENAGIVAAALEALLAGTGEAAPNTRGALAD
jgi:hypothetical protein